MKAPTKENRWPLGSAEGRWKGFGPYYAMFPADFAEENIERYSERGNTVIDPFCGRGTSNYIANLLGRDSIGCDVNPVAWVYSKAKTDPAKQIDRIVRRVDEIWELRRDCDREPATEFQKLAWSPNVLSFLNSARRNLHWRRSKIDWTLAGIILVNLHAKLGGGLSNQMRQCKSMAPRYAVRWWKSRNMTPPNIDPVDFIVRRIRWRYAKGLYKSESSSRIYLGDARDKLKHLSDVQANLLITSPPYMGVTSYEYDNWIRLWLLGGPDRPVWRSDQRYQNKENYKLMIHEVFLAARKLLAEDASIVVRTDRRAFTLETTVNALLNLWPRYRLYSRLSSARTPTQTVLFGDKTAKPGEVDLLMLPSGVDVPSEYEQDCIFQ